MCLSDVANSNCVSLKIIPQTIIPQTPLLFPCYCEIFLLLILVQSQRHRDLSSDHSETKSPCLIYGYQHLVSLFLCLQVICTQPEDYNNREVLCNTTGEGPLLRNPGNHDPNRVRRLPTTVDVETVINLPEYETDSMDRFANRSFRNAVEGTHVHMALIPILLL